MPWSPESDVDPVALPTLPVELPVPPDVLGIDVLPLPDVLGIELLEPELLVLGRELLLEAELPDVLGVEAELPGVLGIELELPDVLGVDVLALGEVPVVPEVLELPDV